MHIISEQAVSQLDHDDEAALAPHRQLQHLFTTLKPLQDAADGAAPHLLDHIDKTAKHLRHRIEDAFAADFEKLLKKMQWPKPDAVVPAALQDEWRRCIVRLLDLQRPELEALEKTAQIRPSERRPLVLLPVEVLLRPLETRFRYHFEGQRPTNRLDKPEYFLSHVIDLLNTYNDFFIDNLQPVLLAHFRGSDLALNPLYVDATSALITGLLPMLRAKTFASLPKAASQPRLLSHWIHEILSFDSVIRDEWRYDGGYGVDGWNGLAWQVLVEKDWFGRWLQVEKDCQFLFVTHRFT